MKNLIPFQADNARALYRMYRHKRRLLLADETGLGKTYSTALIIAMLALEKWRGQRGRGHFNVLYLCSNDRIARKNMAELCRELWDTKLPRQAAKLAGFPAGQALPFRLMDEGEGRRMSRARGARLSIPLDEHRESWINLYAATPDTSFRAKGSSAAAGGSAEERAALLRRKKLPSGCSKQCGDCSQFSRCRRDAALSNAQAKGFDLIILDEFQSYEDILSHKLWPPKNGFSMPLPAAEDLTVEELAEKLPGCRLLLLSATPYQTKASDADPLADLERLLAFLDPELPGAFRPYRQALLASAIPLAGLKQAKEDFQIQFRQVCRRNQRADASGGEKAHSTRSFTASHFPRALQMELKASALLLPEDAGDAPADQEDDAARVTPSMAQDTPWPVSFAKGYLLRDHLPDAPEGYWPRAVTLPCRDAGGCADWPEGVPGTAGAEQDGDRLNCRRVLSPVPADLSRPWPSWKAEAVRRAALGEPRQADGVAPALMGCVWLPPSSPEYLPEEGSPCFALHKRHASKTLVFCRYRMTTRALAALLSQEAAGGGETLPLTEEDWAWLSERPEGIAEPDAPVERVTEDNYAALGHPFLCARRALKEFAPGVVLDALARSAARELTGYLRRPEIQPVLYRAGVRDPDGLLRYCANGNLTAVLREYWSECGLDLPKEYDLYAALDELIPGLSRKTIRQRFEKAMDYFWKHRDEPDPSGLLSAWLNAAGRTAAAFSLLLGKAPNLPPELTDWNAKKSWLLPLGCGCEQGTYAGQVFELFHGGVRGILPQDAGALTADELVRDQIRVCADILETGTAQCRFRPRYYAARAGDPLQAGNPDAPSDGGRTNLREGKYQVLGSQGLFDGNLLGRLWDALSGQTTFLPRLPQSHVCADLMEPDGHTACVRVPLGFACRYDSAVQDTGDHNDNGAEQIAQSFNSPFYPFVLLTSDVAREGLSFHLYCRRLVHLSPTDRPATLIQRNGRVDRYHALAIRQRLADQLDAPIQSWRDSWDELRRSRGNPDPSRGMCPDWYLPAQGGPEVELYHLNHPGTGEPARGVELVDAAARYTQMLGSLLPEELSQALAARYPHADMDALAQAVRLELCPPPEEIF